jgi:hypothetical protein
LAHRQQGEERLPVRKAGRNPKWEVVTVDVRYAEIAKEEFELRLEEILEVLLKRKAAFSPLSTDGLAPNQKEIA